MKRLISHTLTGLVVLASVCHIAFGGLAEGEQGDLMRVYEVNKKVSDFPEEEDFSTRMLLMRQ